VTGRQVRPLLLLQKRRGVLCEANTKYILHNTKVSKCFPGSWKMENRKQAKEDIMLSHSPLLAFVTTMERKPK